MQVCIMENLAKSVARYLLQIKAIKLQPANPFTWASGWKSPIYCDNRKTLSYPEVRSFIKEKFVETIYANFTGVDLIAGVATGAIAQGVLVAQDMNLPFVYVRSEAKKHGLENMVEGEAKPGQKVIIIEDLISTGGSSLKAAESLRQNGCEVLGMVAIFSYSFKTAEDNFKNAGVKLITLSSYFALLDEAVETGYITASEIETLKRWRENPSQWNN
jgi:orotate phosphoribosyltransferase